MEMMVGEGGGCTDGLHIHPGASQAAHAERFSRALLIC